MMSPAKYIRLRYNMILSLQFAMFKSYDDDNLWRGRIYTPISTFVSDLYKNACISSTVTSTFLPHLPWAMIKIQKKAQTKGQHILNPLGLLILENIVQTLKHKEKKIFCRPKNGP